MRFPCIFFFLLGLLLCLPAGAQDFPYQLDLKQEAIILGGAGALSGWAHLREARLDGLTTEELSVLNPANVNWFDRGATRQQNDDFRRLSDDILVSSAALPGLLLLNKRVRNKPLTLAVMLGETFLVTEGITKAGKVLFTRNRPLTYNEDISPGLRQNNDARQSFPSGHTSISAGMSFFTAKVFHDLYPDSKLRPFVWAGAALVPLATGYSRYRAGKHFPTDIIAGYAIGATVGVLIPEFHKTTDARGLRLDITGNGLGLVYRW